MKPSCIDEPVRTRSSQQAILNPDAVTYGELDHHAAQTYSVLAEGGCEETDRVIVALPDSLEFVVVFVAVQKMGAVAVPVPNGLHPDEYRRMIEQTEATILVCEKLLAAQIGSVDCSMLTIEVGKKHRESLSWELTVGSASGKEREAALTAELALLLYTSGSTTRAKCVMHSQRSLVAACENVGSDLLGLQPADRVLCIPKPSFAYGLGFGVLFPMFAGASTIVTSKSPDLAATVQILRSLRPTVLCAVPSFLAVLLQFKELDRDDLSSLRFVTSAGEPLKSHLYETYRSRFNVEVLDGIGATETLTHIISNRPMESLAGTCGTEVRDCHVSLVDQSGNRVPAGAIGTLHVKGPTVFLGYWKDPELSAAVRTNEGLLLRDNLYVDTRGRYVYCGRDDDMLKVAGVWVSAGEVQDEICRHPGVNEAFVTAREDGKGRRRLVAYVVPNPGTAITGSEILLQLRSRLPTHSVPSAFVITGEIARTRNGKVSRSELAEPVW